MATGTLDANSETFTAQLSAGEYAAVTLDISATITVTGTANGATYTKPDGSAAAWTASDHFIIQAPARLFLQPLACRADHATTV